jgi:hypothetical protein
MAMGLKQLGEQKSKFYFSWASELLKIMSKNSEGKQQNSEGCNSVLLKYFLNKRQ